MRSIGRIVASVSLCAAVFMILCGADCDNGERQPTADLQLTSSDFGRSVELRVGQTVDIEVDENGSTGYTWRYSWRPRAGLTLVGDIFEGSDSRLAGAGGVRHFVLRAVQPGRVVVTLQYGRWWKGGDREPAERITFTVSK